MNFRDLIRFSTLLDQLRRVERVIHIKGTKRNENDTEHMYMLAMLAWYLCSVQKLKLDMEKVFMYVLAHDVVEVYAGDTYLHSKDKKLHETKKQREYDAYLRIKKEFPEFKELHKAILNYEKRKDPEAIFAYGLDKIQPCIMLYLDNGYGWKKDKITFDMVKKSKSSVVEENPFVKKFWKEFLEICEKEEKYLFPKRK